MTIYILVMNLIFCEIKRRAIKHCVTCRLYRVEASDLVCRLLDEPTLILMTVGNEVIGGKPN